MQGKGKPKAETIKSGTKKSPWSGGCINKTFKAIVEMNPRNMEDPRIKITHAQGELLALLGYDYSSLPFPFLEVISKANNRSTIFSIEQTLIKGCTSVHYINLQKRDREILSCHLTVTGFPINPKEEIKEMRIFKSSEGCISSDLRVAVLTVRSASMVGNALQKSDNKLLKCEPLEQCTVKSNLLSGAPTNVPLDSKCATSSHNYREQNGESTESENEGVGSTRVFSLPSQEDRNQV